MTMYLYECRCGSRLEEPVLTRKAAEVLADHHEMARGNYLKPYRHDTKIQEIVR